LYKIALGILSTLLAIPFVDVNAANPDLVFEDDETIDRIVDYCFSNTMSNNPVQDLIDRGIISSAFNGQDCQSIQLEKNVRESDRSSAEFMRDLANAK
jgi:hypothetical protein